MVASVLNSAIKYRDPVDGKPIGSIDATDLGHRATQYEVQLPISGSKRYLVALGKVRFDYSGSYDVVYFLAYLVRRGKIIGSIGIYEVDKHAFTSMLDSTKDIELNGLTMLLYPGVTDEFIQSQDAEFTGEFEDSNEEDIDTVDQKNQQKKNETVVEMDDVEDEGAFAPPTRAVALNRSNNSNNQENQESRLTFATLFTKDEPPPKRSPVISQTIQTQRDLAKHQRDEYTKRESPADNWVQKFMHSKRYTIEGNTGAGDCFFLPIVAAFKELGYHTTVPLLRQMLSQEITQEIFDEYRNRYSEFSDNLESVERDKTRLKNKSDELKKALAESTDKKNSLEIVAAANNIRAEYAKKNIEREQIKENMSDVLFMKHITTLPDFRKYIQTSNYWADDWAVTTLEQILRVKFVILRESNDPDDVIQCGHSPVDISMFKPTHYILLDFSEARSGHYQLISENNRRIFTFAELPFDIKMLVTNKCMERSAGAFYIIPEFRQFQQELGIDVDTMNEKQIPDVNKPTDENTIDDVLFEPDIMFRFHAESDGTKPPGGVNGEKLVKKRAGEFAELAKRKDWRRQIDDDWIGGPFVLGQSDDTTATKLRWASVTHYVCAYPLRDTDPDAFVLFSLDSGSMLSKAANAARESVTKKGKKEGKYFKQIDKLRQVDEAAFDMAETEARKRALVAKFSQNADLNTTLSLTKKAKLLHFVRGLEPETDALLMLVRQKLSHT